MATYQSRAANILDVLADAQASIKQAAYDLGGDLAGDDGLEALANINQARMTLDAAERLAVSLVRSGGSSWEIVGNTLGTTRQAAHERFSRDIV